MLEDKVSEVGKAREIGMVVSVPVVTTVALAGALADSTNIATVVEWTVSWTAGMAELPPASSAILPVISPVLESIGSVDERVAESLGAFARVGPVVAAVAEVASMESDVLVCELDGSPCAGATSLSCAGPE